MVLIFKVECSSFYGLQCLKSDNLERFVFGNL